MKGTVCFLGLVVIIIYSTNANYQSRIHIYSVKFVKKYTNRVQLSGSVDSFKTVGLLACSMKCTESDQCVSFFHNDITDMCVLHSKHFIFLPPDTNEFGWKYYLTGDGSGRCPPHLFLYYRKLDFCYQISVATVLDFDKIEKTCQDINATLAAVDSLEKDIYFKHILANRTHERVPVAGRRISPSMWALPDGTPLTYLNWYHDQPNSNNQMCLELYTDDKLFDLHCLKSYPGIFVCEK